MLIFFVNKHNILSEAQTGFRKMKSTETASQTFIESIQEAMNQWQHVAGIFFDLTKAYSVLNHDTLLDKLDSYGIRDNMNLWFKSCLSNHSQFVEITELELINFTQYIYISWFRKNNTWSAIGLNFRASFVFVIYINDIPLSIRGIKLVLFADETDDLLLTKIRLLSNKKCYVMKEIEIWFKKSDLIINIEKTVTVFFIPIS